MDLDAHRGARIKSERKRLGLTQQAAADAAGVRREMWAKYEAGAEPGAKALAGMAEQGVDINYVLVGVEPGETALSADEQALLGLFRAAPLTVKTAAISALMGAQGVAVGAGEKQTRGINNSAVVSRSIMGIAIGSRGKKKD